MTHEQYGQAYQDGYSRTVRLLRSRGASIDVAEDVAQAAWLRGWQKSEQLRNETKLLSWVNEIAMNCHRRGLQNEARYQALPEHCGHVGLDLAPLDAAKVLNFCRPRERMLLEEQMGGFTTKEIAKNHGVSETAIRIRLLRARRAVRIHVEGRASERRKALRTRGGASGSK